MPRLQGPSARNAASEGDLASESAGNAASRGKVAFENVVSACGVSGKRAVGESGVVSGMRRQNANSASGEKALALFCNQDLRASSLLSFPQLAMASRSSVALQSPCRFPCA